MVIGVRDNTVCLGFLRHLFVAPLCVANQFQDLPAISFHFVLIDFGNLRQFREVWLVISLDFTSIGGAIITFGEVYGHLAEGLVRERLTAEALFNNKLCKQLASQEYGTPNGELTS